jgi:hypothetical protein
MNEDRVVQLCSSENVKSMSLCKWAQHCNARRGLEKYCTRQGKRLTIIEHHQQEVLSIANYGAFDEEIAAVAIRSSASSVLYARMLGEADSFYVAHYSHEPDPEEANEKYNNSPEL